MKLLHCKIGLVAALLGIYLLAACTQGTPNASAPPKQRLTNTERANLLEVAKAALRDICNNQSPADKIRLVRNELSNIDTDLPNIPPEESAYLQRKSKVTEQTRLSETALDKRNLNSQAQALENRRLYHVWLVRKDLTNAIISADGIYEPSKLTVAWRNSGYSGSPPAIPGPLPLGTDQADLLDGMLSAGQYIARAASSLSEFLEHERYRHDGLLTQEQLADIKLRSLGLPNLLYQAQKCQLAHMVLDQPVLP